MRYEFGYAGIPSEVYDGIYSKRTWICGDNASFISKPIHPSFGGVYTNSYGDFFLSKFFGLIASDHENSLRDTGFALIVICSSESDTKEFVSRFFPSFLCIPVEWTLDKTNNITIRQSKNRLLNILKVATNHAKDAIPAVKKEVSERNSRTPLLLPVKNFRSKLLVSELEELQDELSHVRDKRQAIGRIIQKIEQTHPLQQSDSDRKSFFVDDRDVEFHPPGNDRHGFARANTGHPPNCLLSGRRRLGAPYEFAFHYDCTRRAGVLKDSFFGCHEDPSTHEGRPHLNIAPNDFVRP